MTGHKGPTRAQLQAKIKRLEKQLQKLAAGDSLRQEGEHWYELIEYFDPHAIQRIPGPSNAFMMGMLQDAIVVQIPEGTEPEEVPQFVAALSAKGIDNPVLVVTDKVRFVKLGTVSEEMEARLDAAVLREESEPRDEARDVSLLQAAEGQPDGAKVPEVSGREDREADTGGADSVADVARE